MPAAWNDQTSTSWCLEAVPRRSRKWLSLLSLRFGTILCNIIAVPCFAWAMEQHYKGIVATDGLGQTWAGMNLGTSAYGLIWSTIFLIVVLCNCAVHPGVIIAFDFIAFCAQLITVCFHLYELTFYHLGGYGSYGRFDVDRLYGIECLGCSVYFQFGSSRAGFRCLPCTAQSWKDRSKT
ncbi:uncharacterized protein N7506_006691 [Penicillium brevicompactum]|uniref:uncharacterized protein n=1 Tax=Penicillium brevicompactum TaxID=5074 RepID=UPI002541D8A1|nr:uncharacterized protein N7506_006691 [Penicillium brevicompactum]KAJ5332908.1 hypothetical protein N7506_006691 [Penicillium brevicompactum]